MKRTDLQKLHRRISRWYDRFGRDLPWRRTGDPYKILVSEVMLQQTQVSRVLEHYPRFLRTFPNFSSLARASGSRLLETWAGMGYNNRVIRLRALARIVRDRYNGRLPTGVDELSVLPGIGRYTAHAIACFAFGATVPVVDTNIARVLSRLHPRRRDVWKIAAEVLPSRTGYRWNQALMDFGSLVCTASSPRCSDCPLNDLCPSAFRIRKGERRTSKEPGRNGIPNRIYRGRIVSALRRQNGSGALPSGKIGKLIKSDFSRRDKRWLMSLLTALERDGVVRLKRTRERAMVSFVE